MGRTQIRRNRRETVAQRASQCSGTAEQGSEVIGAMFRALGHFALPRPPVLSGTAESDQTIRQAR